jgi:DNA helicase II / ATP-dependent DNA helicase PcrA
MKKERKKIRVTTFHKIKGETLDAALVVSSRTRQRGGHWQKWLEHPAREEARSAYVASSRPKHIPAWAIPALNLDGNVRKRLDELGFIESQ